MMSLRVVLAVAAAGLTTLALFLGLDLMGIGSSESSVRWSLDGVSDDGRTLLISYVDSSCDSPDRVEKLEAADSIHLLVVLQRWSFSSDCDEGEHFRTDVVLERPLAGRQLVDRHTAPPRRCTVASCPGPSSASRRAGER